EMRANPSLTLSSARNRKDDFAAARVNGAGTVPISVSKESPRPSQDRLAGVRCGRVNNVCAADGFISATTRMLTFSRPAFPVSTGNGPRLKGGQAGSGLAAWLRLAHASKAWGIRCIMPTRFFLTVTSSPFDRHARLSHIGAANERGV